MVQSFLCDFILDWVEVSHLVLREVPLQLCIGLHSLELYLVVSLSGFVDLLIVMLLHLVGFLLLLFNLPLKIAEHSFVIIFFFNDVKLNLLSLFLLVDDCLLKFVELALEVRVLSLDVFNDCDLLLELTLLVCILLALDEFTELLGLVESFSCCL